MLLILPLLVPLTTAALTGLLWRLPRAQQGLSCVGAGVLLASGVALLEAVWREGIQVLHVGGWPAPAGISFVADLLGALMVVLTGVVGLAGAVYAVATVDRYRKAYGFAPFLHVLLLGVCGAFLTGDLFNLYVWFEVMLIASFVLLALGGERAQLEGAVKYVTLNLMSSALFLAAVGILYGVTGTLDMADLAVKLREAPRPGLVTTVAVLFLVAFGIKAAVFPLFFWLPASYHTPPAAVSALFSGLLTKVGVYALLRIFTLLFTQDVPYTHGLILLISGFTMVSGVLGAAAQFEARRLLAFHIVSQIGYMLMGLGLYTPLALAGAILYVAHNILAKTNLFLVAGAIHHLRGTYRLERLGGLYPARPGLATLFVIPALALAGLPPFSGFFAKLVLLRAGLELERWGLVAAAAGVSLLTLFSMSKIWTEAFWKPPEPGTASAEPERALPWTVVAPMVGLAALTLGMSLCFESVLALASRAAEQLLDVEAYVAAVRGGAP
ncbi:MAG TPA: Na+/H+ antiporter subunit D [Myxococcaceae bacterium]|nr:Na+/H+ antiporter subunit D [Myxococcaceae bacterium]